ncbi:MAG: MmgE/PrpD family protein [Xanthobacteraceae bacterium]|nr:MmgE/PrpD family protein [Xanthobacteraceae bacterium]
MKTSRDAITKPDRRTLLRAAAALPLAASFSERAGRCAGGEKQFSDRAVTDPQVVALRGKVNPVVTPGIDPAQVDMTVVTEDGRSFNRYIAHAVGSVEVPMTDEQLEAKFSDLADGILPAPTIRQVMDLCWNVEKLDNAADIAKMSVSS